MADEKTIRIKAEFQEDSSQVGSFNLDDLGIATHQAEAIARRNEELLGSKTIDSYGNEGMPGDSNPGTSRKTRKVEKTQEDARKKTEEVTAEQSKLVKGLKIAQSVILALNGVNGRFTKVNVILIRSLEALDKFLKSRASTESKASDTVETFTKKTTEATEAVETAEQAVKAFEEAIQRATDTLNGEMRDVPSQRVPSDDEDTIDGILLPNPEDKDQKRLSKPPGTSLVPQGSREILKKSTSLEGIPKPRTKVLDQFDTKRLPPPPGGPPKPPGPPPGPSPGIPPGGMGAGAAGATAAGTTSALGAIAAVSVKVTAGLALAVIAITGIGAAAALAARAMQGYHNMMKEGLGDFSGTLKAAEAQTQAFMIQEKLRHSQNRGDSLAQAEGDMSELMGAVLEFKAQFQDLVDGPVSILVQCLELILDAVNWILEKLNGFIETVSEGMAMIVENLGSWGKGIARWLREERNKNIPDGAESLSERLESLGNLDNLNFSQKERSRLSKRNFLP